MKIFTRLLIIVLFISSNYGCGKNNNMKEAIHDTQVTLDSPQQGEKLEINTTKSPSELIEEITENMIHSFSKVLINGDALYFRYDNNLITIHNDKAVKIPLKENNMENIWDNQVFLSHDKTHIYYSSNIL